VRNSAAPARSDDVRMRCEPDAELERGLRDRQAARNGELVPDQDGSSGSFLG